MKKVLIVDDEIFIRYILTEALKDSMLEIFEAKNGQEALEEAAQIHPDLMILDVKMAGIDGFTVAREYKKIAPSCPIMIFTAESDSVQMYEENKAFVDYFIQKPCNLVTLSKMVKEILAIS